MASALVPPSERAAQAGGLRRRTARRLRRLGPAHLVALGLVLAAGVLCLGPLADPDLFWHLRTGELVLDRRGLPGTEPWAFRALGDEWVAHEWLSEVGLRGLYALGGYEALRGFRAAAVVALLALLARQAFGRTAPWPALLCLACAWLATTAAWTERPQLLSLLLLVPAWAVLRAAGDGTRSAWPLIPLTFLWANLHGLWATAVVLVAVVALGVLLDDGAAGLGRAGRLLAVGAGMVVAAAVTPNGYRLLLSPLDVPRYARFVTEWDPWSVRSAFGFGFVALLAVVLWAWARRGDVVPPSRVLYVLAAVMLALSYTRTVAPAAVLLLPLAVEALQHRSPRPVEDGPPLLHGAVAVALVLAATTAGALAVRTLPSLGEAYRSTPQDALEALPAGTRLLNEYDMGGWVLWTLPDLSPSVDGRAEVYDLEYLQAHADAYALRGDWRGFVAGLGADAAWLRRDTALVVGLVEVLGWSVRHADDDWVVLTPP